MRGRKLRKGRSRRIFRKHSKVHKRNFAHHASRGGIRL